MMWACAFSTWLLPRQPQVLQGHTESVYCFLNLLDHEMVMMLAMFCVKQLDRPGLCLDHRKHTCVL